MTDDPEQTNSAEPPHCDRSPSNQHTRATSIGDSSDNRDDRSPYDWVFLFAYASNAFLLIAVSLLFRYSDFVKVHQGGEWELGLIVGVGAIGAIAFRVFQGVGIDLLGTRMIWIGSLICYCSAIFLHCLIVSVDTLPVYLIRILMHTGLAGTFGASLTFISLRVAPRRVTEVLGMHGTSGFVGMAIGPFIGDLLFAGHTPDYALVNKMFQFAGLFGLFALGCAVLATRGKIHRRPSRRLPTMAIIRRYQPGTLLIVAAVMGMGLSMPGVFVRPYAESIGIEQIRWFFIAYNIVAFTVRVATRRLPERLGERTLILTGLALLIASMPTYLCVTVSWQLIFPAIVTGLAHAFLFPSVVASGGHAFPTRYRGLATTLILTMFDLGNLIGQPLLGGVVTLARENGMAPYPIMFATASAILVIAILVFAVSGRNAQRNPRSRFHGRASTSR